MVVVAGVVVSPGVVSPSVVSVVVVPGLVLPAVVINMVRDAVVEGTVVGVVVGFGATLLKNIIVDTKTKTPTMLKIAPSLLSLKLSMTASLTLLYLYTFEDDRCLNDLLPVIQTPMAVERSAASLARGPRCCSDRPWQGFCFVNSQQFCDGSEFSFEIPLQLFSHIYYKLLILR